MLLLKSYAHLGQMERRFSMSIGNFNEVKENRESNKTIENTDNTEKYKNQILEVSESYDDDFDKKLDSIDDKREGEGGGEKNTEKSETTEKDSTWERLRNFFSKKEEGENAREYESKDSKERSSDNEGFRDRFKVDNTDNHIERQAAENMEKKAESSAESNADSNDGDNDITKNEGRSRAEEAYNKHYHIRDDER